LASHLEPLWALEVCWSRKAYVGPITEAALCSTQLAFRKSLDMPQSLQTVQHRRPPHLWIVLASPRGESFWEQNGFRPTFTKADQFIFATTMNASTHDSLDQTIRDCISDVFDIEFEFFELQNGVWIVAGLPGATSDALANIAAIPRNASPHFEQSQEGGWLAIPFRWEDEWLLAVSQDTLPFSDDRMRTASLLQKNFGLQHEIWQQQKSADQFAIQVSRDFEELTFLQRMVESLEFAAADASFSEVTETIFAMLVRAIGAKSIIFVPNEEENVRLPPYMIGESIDFDRRAVLEASGHDFSSGPLVRNRIHDQRHPELRQLVAVEIRNKESAYGWLLAVNRADGVHCSLDGARSEAEFGTYEATLLSSAAAVIATYGLNRELLRRKEKLLLDLVRCLVSAIDAKDDYTRGHSVRVAQFARCLAEQLNWSSERCDQIYMTGLLHDVGKIGVPDAVLNKPDTLDESERELIRKHPDHGWSILHRLKELGHVIPGVVHHHEEFNGQGYPDRLEGEQIPIEGRLIAVVDAYDAIVSARAYRDGSPHEEALNILLEGAGTQWDPEIVRAFEKAADTIASLAESYQHKKQPVRKPTRV